MFWKMLAGFSLIGGVVVTSSFVTFLAIQQRSTPYEEPLYDSDATVSYDLAYNACLKKIRKDLPFTAEGIWVDERSSQYREQRKDYLLHLNMNRYEQNRRTGEHTVRCVVAGNPVRVVSFSHHRTD